MDSLYAGGLDLHKGWVCGPDLQTSHGTGQADTKVDARTLVLFALV